MLAHQLPSLPPLESFWRDLEPFFLWLESGLQTKNLTKRLKTDSEIFSPGPILTANVFDAVVHKIQFAASNRMCVEFTCDDKKRVVEPLCFRQSKFGNKLFYGYEKNILHPKCFSISKIQNIVITNLPYQERDYPIEINAAGSVSMPLIRRKNRNGVLAW